VPDLRPYLRGSGGLNLLFSFDKFAIDTDRRELRCDGDLCAIEPQVFDLLEFLIRNRDRVVSRNDLLDAVWNGRIVSEGTLTSRINAARTAIDDNGRDQRLIRTVLRKGIRFVGVVHEEPEAESASTAAPATKQHGTTFPLPDRPSIAVLPFFNISGEPEQEYFADGMAEEITTALSRCSWLFVIARNSSFTYKGKAVDVRQVGRELGVRYVLEGSVRRGGNRLRFTGQLIDAISGGHIWADRFEGDVGDVFELQDLFTESVVAAIEPKLQLAEIERLKHKPATSLDAYDLLLRAQQREHEFTEESLAQALLHLEQALLIDPVYAPAMALVAYCLAERRINGWMRDPHTEKMDGLHFAMRAVELGNDDGNVFWMAAYAIFRLAWDAGRAKELARRSLQLNPNSANALAELGRIEAFLGNYDIALELLLRAERLGPRDPRGWFVKTELAFAYYLAGRQDEAASMAERVLNQKPRFGMAFRIIAASSVKRGRQREAEDAVRRALEIEPQLTLTRLRPRVMANESDWLQYSSDLRRAGLPE
jgi:TolB-like protein/Flp pilus assembly protein TadD